MAEVDRRLSQYPQLEFGVDLARKIWRTVWPVYGLKQNDVPINQISHDFNYVLDQKAEAAVRQTFEKSWRNGLLYGYATEDQGLVKPPGGKAEYVFLIDPVDGSRPANIGAENACVNIGISNGQINEPTLDDIEMGITLALKEKLMLAVIRGKGVYQIQPPINKGWRIPRLGSKLEGKQNITSNLKDCSMTFETYSMSNELLGVVIDPLMSEVSFKTESPSGSYSVLSLIRGQNELVIDVRRRAILDFPEIQVMIKQGGKAGSPMDIAPQFLMSKELGMVVTDAYGNSLDKVKLWQFNSDGSWASENQLSLVAAASPTLHRLAMEKIEEGFAHLSQRYPRT